MTNFEIQKIAKDTIEYLKENLTVGMKLYDLKSIAENHMKKLGANGFWYYGIGALIFSGEQTTLSVSGRKYKVADRAVAENDIITVDLSPCSGKVWGDYARTVIVENGKVCNDVDSIQNDEWREGIIMEKILHDELISFARPDTTFDELNIHISEFISDKGYVNLDFLGNFGHSIATQKRKRIYIEKGNKTCLSDVKYFTFEPHVCRQNGRFGYKRENIYYFADGELREL